MRKELFEHIFLLEDKSPSTRAHEIMEYGEAFRDTFSSILSFFGGLAKPDIISKSETRIA